MFLVLFFFLPADVFSNLHPIVEDSQFIDYMILVSGFVILGSACDPHQVKQLVYGPTRKAW